MNTKRIAILFSGGKDSTLSLLYVLKKYNQDLKEVDCLFFNYGQKNKDELFYAMSVIEKLAPGSPLNKEEVKITLHTFPVQCLFSTCNRTGLLSSTDKLEAGTKVNNLAQAFVPNRNLLFLTLGYNFCYYNDIDFLFTGSVPEAEGRGYPDNTSMFYTKVKDLLFDSSRKMIYLLSPFFNMSLEDLICFLVYGKEQDYKQHLYNLLVENTYSCHNGVRDLLPYGQGCGECGACKTREKDMNIIYKTLFGNK